jgi:PAS domain S-box-containing protein
VAIASVVLGWLAREALTPGIGPTALPFIFFFPAVAIAAWFGGFGPGLFAIVLSLLAANWFFIAPTPTLTIRSIYDVLALAAFALSALLIVGAIKTMHRAQARLVDEIAERKRAEAELAKARHLVSTTVASIGDAVIVTDDKGNITFLNAEAERLTGWKISEANGRPLAKVFHIINEKTRQAAENPVEKVFRTGKVTGLANHTLLISKDGRETPIDDSAAPIRELDSPLFGVVLVFRDVTEQRKAQLAAERLGAIIEHSGDAIFTKNLNGVIQTWNSSAERLFGYRAEEIVGKHITVLFPPDRLNEEDHIIGRLRQGQPIERLQTIRVAKGGRQIPVAVSVSPLKDADGEIIGASKIVHDISDIVAAREALVQEKELLATTLASIGDAVIVTDAQGRITFVNAEAERLTKWSNTDAAGQPLPKVFRITNEKTRAPVENPVEKVLRLGTVVGLANHTVLIAKDGTETPIDDSAAPIRKPDGPLFGVVLVFRDFTEKKQAEQALRQAQEELRQHAATLETTVAQRTASLRETVTELEAFSYSIAHDMRAPLRAMQGFARILESEHSAQLDSEAQSYLQRIQAAATRLDRLIVDILNYSKVVRGILELQPVDPETLINDIVSSYPSLHKDDVKITIESPLPRVLANDAALTQVISNLLDNAVKFVAPGVHSRVRIWGEKDDRFVRIWFEDNGIGIPKESQGRLFNIFTRLNQSDHYEGTGIGLAIVRKAVERMGGSVGVESDRGQGSRFWVRLQSVKGKNESG